MKTTLILLFSLFTGILTGQAQEKTSFVDPLIGAGAHGHVFVGASVPFGAVQLGPNNIFKGWDWCSGYHYSDSILIGFSHTHLSGTGGSDLGDVLVMPFTGAVKPGTGTQADPHSGFAARFSHADEKVKPGYYSLFLKESGIKVELTASERVGFHHYQFPAGEQGRVMIDLKDGTDDETTASSISLKDDHTLVGYRLSKGWANDQRLYFAIRSSRPIKDFKVYDDLKALTGTSGAGKGIKGVISLGEGGGEVLLKVGISPVSSANALSNIEAEIPDWNFNRIVRLADQKWNKELSKVEISTRSTTDKKIFYTALFHTMIDPALFNDHNGDYRGTDKKVYRHAAFNNYTVFSLWDTYRALDPLYTLIQPEKESDLINTMLAIYKQQGRLPIWHLEGCETGIMPGISGVQVVVEAWMKGFKGIDTQLAWEAVKASTMRHELGLDYVKKLEYIPSDKVEESVAKAMEYSITDGSVALMAKKLGKEKEYAYYTQRSKNYRLYFDSSSKFFRGKLASGKWNPVFIPAKFSHPWINDYSEGNAWEYLWLVPQDVEGLMGLLGGEKAFDTKLDSTFALKAAPDPNMPLDVTGLIGQYAHGDEPGHHNIYLYAYAGKQWKAAEKARYICSNLYLNSPEGISGNEDCGQMSAWYVFSSMGFYPVFPANGAYVFGSPQFDRASISLPGGKKFTVIALNNSPANMYIQQVRLNGKPYSRTYIMHPDIVRGGVLEFTMGNTPNTAFGSAMADRPKSAY